ncbi:hypothetical protein [Bradyrhizobium sp. Bra78]|uniref:hypothetical protein n=1 Tax=Bradyrhizobium sp. Bra78 TaxID=2926010 RepID=UPI0021C8E902|nr:hypothetical protein [Bradyrhizobium sp. Bra78]
MTDLAITAANVVQGSNAKLETGLAGETITAGQWVYQDPTTRKLLKADSDSATASVRKPRGLALNGASLNQPLVIQKKGQVTIGGTLTAGLAYYLSKTASGMCPVADIAAGGYATTLGIAISTTVFDINIEESGVAV